MPISSGWHAYWKNNNIHIKRQCHQKRTLEWPYTPENLWDCSMRQSLHRVKWAQIKICHDGVTSSESSCVLRLRHTQNICPVMFCPSASLPRLPDSDSKLFPFMDPLSQKGLLKWERNIKNQQQSAFSHSRFTLPWGRGWGGLDSPPTRFKRTSLLNLCIWVGDD